MLSRVALVAAAICIKLFAGFRLIGGLDQTHEEAYREEVTTIQSNVFSMQDLVERWDYPLEHYTVQTHDGYLLGLYRISHGRSHDARNHTSNRPAVLLQHGLLMSSAAWVDNSPKQSLGFCLADAGFDVWLGNSRGSTYSRSHIALAPEDVEFWNFSWDEMASGDLPAIIDYVIAATGQPTIGYVGHSQGTTMALAAFSENAALSAKVNAAALLAPVAFLQHLDSPPIKQLATLDTDEVFKLLGLQEVLPASDSASAAMAGICSYDPGRCMQVLDTICGVNGTNINATRLPAMLHYTPAGSSVRNLAHWAQGVRLVTPKFQMFDWGNDCSDYFFRPQPCNKLVYGTEKVPEYNLSSITVPLGLFSGGKDKMASPPDVQALIRALPEASLRFHHHEGLYGHVDFTWGLDASEKIHPTIIAFLHGSTEDKVLEDATEAGQVLRSR